MRITNSRNLAFEVARVRVVPNLLPATGPVQAGGDQGRDFESYRTYLASSSLGTSAFATTASESVVVGACSLQKNIVEKIKGDLETIFASGTRPDHVAYFCEADVPVAKRHELQDLCQNFYNATLDIFDGQALADILAERDTFWIAEKFLSVPADEWPADFTDDHYHALRDRWIIRGEKPQNYAEFLEIKQGLRTAAFDESVKPDLSSWLQLIRNFMTDDMSDRLVQKARYEIAVAELRGRGSLDPARKEVEQFFYNLSSESGAAELMDGAVLAVYAWGAVGHGRTSIPIETVEAWSLNVQAILDVAIANIRRIVDRCTLLEAKAVLWPVLFAEKINSEVSANKFFDLWGDVVKQVQVTPYYPVTHIARIMEEVTPLLGTHPRFRPIVDDVDLLVAERAGAGAAADLARRRAVAHLRVKRFIAALNELQKAKIGWFSSETMRGSILSMLVISQSLSELNLHFAARYYAAGALFLALNQEDEGLERHIGDALFRLADTFHAAGEGIIYFYALTGALEAHHAVASDPHDWTKHSHVQASFAQATILRAIARHLDPAVVPLIDKAISLWPLPQAEKKAFIELSEKPPWANMTREEIEGKIACELGQHPFSDIGSRSATWSALGILWTVKGSPNLECWLAVSELAAVLQLAQVEFGDTELIVIPSAATIEVELSRARKIDIKQLPDNGKLAWRVTVPVEHPSGAEDDYTLELASVAITILGQATALRFDTFKELAEKRFQRGLASRFFSVRPIRELLAFVQPDGIPYPVLTNTIRRSLSIDVTPIESDELKWTSSPGPGYSKEKAEEFLRNRYDISRRAVALTLPRPIRDDRCRTIIQGLKAEGFLDWQILSLICSIVAQQQVEAQFPNVDPRKLDKEMTDRIYRKENVSDPEFDLGAFTAEIVNIQKKILSIAALSVCPKTN